MVVHPGRVDANLALWRKLGELGEVQTKQAQKYGIGHHALTHHARVGA
jgi:hypothetical protein